MQERLISLNTLLIFTILFLSSLLISVNQLYIHNENNFQDNVQNAYSNSYSHSQLLYSVNDELPIASIILNHYFIHDTILTEMKISYLGSGLQNESNEHISIAGDIDNLIIVSENESVEFQLEFKDQINQSDVFFTLNELIPKGQYLILELQWEQTISIESSSTHNISVYWNKEIGISAMKVVLSPGYSYAGATNLPNQVKPESNELVLRWTEIFKESFTCSLLTLYLEPYFEEQVSVTPLAINIVERENKIIDFEINIENTGNSTLQVKIIPGNGIISLNSSNILLKPSSKLVYVFEGDLRKSNILESNITFQIEYYNGSQLIFNISVEISVQDNIDFLFIGLLFLSGLIVIASFFIYKRRKNIQNYYVNKKNQLKSRDQNSISENIIPEDITEDTSQSLKEVAMSEILNKYQIKLKTKEFQVFEILINNPFGHSQVELCEITGISKATMSRIVSQLEVLKLVDREKSGMSKIVKVKNKILNLL
ncbi:MAG: hypothetical protein HeimC3_21550 [Candidatus Heimdallarchaeota archaeon LC_3]|nr:MAG: hypothetical protein HeimC3_21550 [Candidatus Heimdallarchaeota archaeon LC_3]